MKHASLRKCLQIGITLLAAITNACSRHSSEMEATTILPPAVTEIADIGGHGTDNVPRRRDNFYLNTNSAWLATTKIPGDQNDLSSFARLDAETHVQLARLLEGLGSHPSDRKLAKIASLYASFMDEGRAESLGFSPIKGELARIEGLQNRGEIPALIAHFNQTRVSAPYDLIVHQDARDPTQYAADIRQAGLGLPGRDYYLSNDARLEAVRDRYKGHIQAMMRLIGDEGSGTEAADIVELESALALAQWKGADNRDPIKTYNKYALPELSRLISDYDWDSYVKTAGIGGKVRFLNVSQPSYLTAVGRLLRETPLPVWKAYFKWHLLCAAAPYLSKALAEEHFAFYGAFLRGDLIHPSRASRGVTLVNELMGEGLGRIYVEHYFQPKTRDSIDAMVQIVLATFRTRIKSLDWMGPDTQKAAQEKLNKLIVKIGNPQQYRDYGNLTIGRDDLYGNVTRGMLFEYQRNIGKLGKPIQRDEWQVLPQSVTSYYDPQLNEITLPAALLQPPFYAIDADSAGNYGGIGIVIAREISHAFDDMGSQFAADGKLHDWFSGTDRDRFGAKIEALVEQYGAKATALGVHSPGTVTAGESIADNAGITMAYQAYHLALTGKESPVLNGLTGEQRFFTSFACLWRSETLDEQSMVRGFEDAQPPAEIRVNASLMNMTPFYTAFGLEAGDGMYLPPMERVNLW